jgi:hypothetical protein
VYIYLLDSCSIHTLAHPLELSSVLCHSVFLVVIIFCLLSMLSSLQCTSSPPLCSNFRRISMAIVFSPIFGVGYCERVIKGPSVNVSPPPHLLSTGRPSPKPHTRFPPQDISATMGSYQPAFLKRPSSNSSLRTQVRFNAHRGYRSPSLLPAPVVLAASTVLAIIFTPLSS